MQEVRRALTVAQSRYRRVCFIVCMFLVGLCLGCGVPVCVVSEVSDGAVGVFASFFEVEVELVGYGHFVLSGSEAYAFCIGFVGVA